MRERLKVLFLAADPFKDGSRLELGEEVRAIDEAIQRGSARDSVELVSHFATRTRDLQYALLRHEPHIVHFAGHGGATGVIYVGDEHGRPRAVGKEALGRLFGILEGEVRAVVLNGCHTLPVVEVLRDVVDHAIGTNRRISDAAAIGFAAAFYTALAFGRGVRQSFELAVNELQLAGGGEDDIPVLRSRQGAPDGPLLAMPAAGERPAPAGDAAVDHEVTVGDVEADRLNVIGDDQQVPGVAGGSVRSRFTGGAIKGGELNFIGRRTGGPGRD